MQAALVQQRARAVPSNRSFRLPLKRHCVFIDMAVSEFDRFSRYLAHARRVSKVRRNKIGFTMAKRRFERWVSI